jgi:cell division septum initiation protein DivIVA
MTAFLGFSGRLTPDSVQGVSFPPAKLGRRGVDERHVRAFCGQVERELVRLLNERTSLSNEVQRLRNRVLGGEGAGARILQDDAQAQAVHILSTAQQTADRYVADAQAYSRQLADDARQMRDQILAEARARAAAVLEEAHGKASLAAEASLAAPIPGMDDDRRELRAEVAYLRTYSDVYRTHLHTYLDTLLRNVEEWERAEKQSLAAVRGDTPLELPALPDVPAPSPPPPLPSPPPQATEPRGLGLPGRADEPEFGRP